LELYVLGVASASLGSGYAPYVIDIPCGVASDAVIHPGMNAQPKVKRIERIITSMPKTLIEEINDSGSAIVCRLARRQFGS
jgi:hypothetical protein